jgi:hypothetical protein
VSDFLGDQECVPQLVRAWILVASGDTLDELPWSIDTTSVENGIPTSHLASGVANAAFATFVTSALLAENAVVDIYAVDMPINTGASFAGQDPLWFNLYNGAAVVNPESIGW